ncbi:Rnf-Nqr domain containing protein [Pseudomonas sp. NPDC089401]|uniref:Rnf-Nqr domain containing protein n=1 Tax=Pseudomonas sp. NPDC089401 TaxID=3364462 RepID=UPI0038184A3A
MTRHCLLAVSLAPLLGATATLAQAAAIGLAMLVLGIAHQALLVPLRRRLDGALYAVASLLLLAALASCLQLALRAWALPLALSLGYYPALLCLQCLAFDALLPNQERWRQLLVQLGGLVLVCVLLGAARQGLADGLGLEVARQPAGALILLGVLLALYNYLHPGTAPSRRQGTR